MRLLATGFEAFGGDRFNPAEAIVHRLIARPPVADFHGLILPVEYGRAAEVALAALDETRPDAVVLFGLAGRSAGIRLERFGRNTVTATAPDNAGAVYTGQTIVADGPPLFETMVDVHALKARLAAALPAVDVSEDAGGYVCNDLYARMLHGVTARGHATPVLFVHVPWAHPPVAAADFDETPLDAHERAARAVIGALVDQLSPAAGTS
ncbi:pyroglutamyl-peptidase I [Chthonobacter rhizosphaerae]|uniref:pyroglutamyl-peptidase I n=1 Tax=Chthonobacter rhizosphaerae TaxID=2735553 RepID=UPI0015EEE706|nr:pyroglutamyl-peptidase I [Chthonobacter rhizosphaerae]